MKYFLHIVVGILLFWSCTQSQSVRISGTLEHVDSPENTYLRFDGASAWVSGENDLKISINKNDCFDTVFPLKEPAYYIIRRNPVYLSPGDHLRMEIYEYNEQSLFSGKGSEANNYLKKRYFSKGGSYLVSGRYAYPEKERMLAAVDSISIERSKELELVKNVSATFRKNESIRIKAEIINSLLSYPLYNYSNMFTENISLEEYTRIRNNYLESVREYITPLLPDLLSSDKYLEIEVVRSVIADLYDTKLFSFELSSRAKELIETAEMASQIEGNMNLKNYQELFSFGEKISYPDFKIAFMAKLEQNARLMEGKEAPDIEMTDSEGKTIRLSDFKGTPLYVDLWATWCSPCLAESPYFSELSKKYPAITFIAISVDNNKRAWENYMGKKPEGKIREFLSTDPDIHKKWDITGIPRFLFIDKDFNIISSYAPMPSESSTIDSLFRRQKL